MKQTLKKKLDDFATASGKLKIHLEVWITKERQTLIESIKDMFGCSRADIFNKGLLHMLERQSFIEDSIAMNNYAVCYSFINKNKVVAKKPKEGAKYDTIYVYDIVRYGGRFDTIIYKDEPDPTNLSFKFVRKFEAGIDPDILDQFPPSFLEQGMQEN